MADGAECGAGERLCRNHAINPAKYRDIIMNPAPPSLATMAGSALVSVFRFAGSGLATTTPEVQSIRRGTCDACPHRDKKRDRCTPCGCWLVAKISMPHERCPIGKW